MATPQQTKVKINKVKERLLFFAPSVKLGLENEANLKDFDIGDPLGSGAFGSVYKVVHKASKRIFALKVIEKTNIKKNPKMVTQMVNEVKIMYGMKHENVVQLYNHFEDEQNLYLIIEFAEEGQLMNKLKKSATKKLNEATSAAYVRDLVLALNYIHNLTPPVIHRDIKPENLLVAAGNKLKLGDFGWSNFSDDNARTTYCGTPEYLAPEMVTEAGHTEKLDIWCVGVLIFELLTGRTPFSPTKQVREQAEFLKSTALSIMSGKVVFPGEYPPLAKDLTSKLLKLNPSERLSIPEIMKHNWFKQNGVSFDIPSALSGSGTPRGLNTKSQVTNSTSNSQQSINGQPKESVRPVPSSTNIAPSLPVEIKPIISFEKKPVVYEMDGRKLEESEILTEIPNITETEASRFFKRDSILNSNVIPKLDKVMFDHNANKDKYNAADKPGERRSVGMKSAEIISKLNEQLASKDNRIRELEAQLDAVEKEKTRFKSELDRTKYSSTSYSSNGGIGIDDLPSMDTKKVKALEEERDRLRSQVEELYKTVVNKEESLDTLTNKVGSL